MTVLTYRGKKYTQNKEASQLEQPVLLKYRGLEVLSKRIHEAISAEMAWFLKWISFSKKESIRAPFLFADIYFIKQLGRKKTWIPVFLIGYGERLDSGEKIYHFIRC